MNSGPSIELVPSENLRHIEGWSPTRVEWLSEKILSEGTWTKPLALDRDNYLVMDGQHRMEASKKLGFQFVPAILFDYRDVEIWSLRPQYEFDWQTVVERSLSDNPYPYKTVKHKFPYDIPNCAIDLDELR